MISFHYYSPFHLNNSTHSPTMSHPSTNKPKMLLLLRLLLPCLFFNSHSLAYENPRGTHCTESSSAYAPNSTFSTDLSLTLTALRASTAATGFYVSTSGDATAAALCRATVSASVCQACVDAAVMVVPYVCPNRTSAQVWYTLCMVRYSDTNFVNQSDSNITITLSNILNAPYRNVFVAKVDMLMNNLSYAAGVSEKRYAVGRTNFTSNMPIYGYVDCTRDVSGGDCTTCLNRAIMAIPTCCIGKSAGWIVTPTCNIQFNTDPVDHDDWINNPPYIDTDLYTAPSPPSQAIGRASESGSSSSKKVIILTTISVICIVLLALVVVTFIVVREKTKKERLMALQRVENRQVVRNDDNDDDIEARSFMYDFDVLAVATNNFSIENRLGDGGFGTVYRGKMPSGEEIAVKKLTAGSRQGSREFSNEVKLLLKMQHRNLVQLLGFCIQGNELMLVYEYLPNTSLDRLLFDKSKSALLDWARRWNIIIGVARGLVYMHQDSQLKTIHRDIKAANILLDQQMNPKISDFGIAKLFNDDQSRLRTGRIVGTFGYMAPEYAVRGLVSTKGDVFSFGVLMLEIISGRKNYDPQLDEDDRELLNLTKRLDREDRQMELIDVTIGDYPSQDILRCIKIGLLCCQNGVQNRPTMSLALNLLTNHSITLPSAGRVAYQVSRDNSVVAELPTQECSGNGSLTSSLVEGR